MRRVVLKESADFLRCRRKADEIEIDTAQECAFVGGAEGSSPFWRSVARMN
jgi:hypothetical protein